MSQTEPRFYHSAVTAEGRSGRGKDQSTFFWLLKGAEMETGCLEGENYIRLNRLNLNENLTMEIRHILETLPVAFGEGHH